MNIERDGGLLRHREEDAQRMTRSRRAQQLAEPTLLEKRKTPTPSLVDP